MAVTIEIPRQIERALERQLGERMGRTAQIGFAVEAYRAAKLSLGQLAEMLDISTYEADGLLKERGVMLQLDPRGFEEEVASLKKMVGR